jgi:hypothetical protein
MMVMCEQPSSSRMAENRVAAAQRSMELKRLQGVQHCENRPRPSIPFEVKQSGAWFRCSCADPAGGTYGPVNVVGSTTKPPSRNQHA